MSTKLSPPLVTAVDSSSAHRIGTGGGRNFQVTVEKINLGTNREKILGRVGSISSRQRKRRRTEGKRSTRNYVRK